MLGDIVGRPSRVAVKEMLPKLIKEHGLDFVVANGENASGGIGLSTKNSKELLSSGINVLTSGNHIWKFKDLYHQLNVEQRLLRPANFPAGAPGRGWAVFECGDFRVGIINLQGQTYMQPIECPFLTADAILGEMEALEEGCPDIILVDFHAEATSEKTALGWHLDGRIAALVGTHTHIQTSDNRVLTKGMAYITDLGMCGPIDSCLGMKSGPILTRFLTALPTKFEVAGGPIALQGVVLDIDQSTGKARSIKRLNVQ